MKNVDDEILRDTELLVRYKAGERDFSYEIIVGEDEEDPETGKMIATFANLRGAKLVGADFQGAHLVGVHFENAHLVGTYFRDARLAGAHFDCADLTDANLIEADLTNVDFTGAILIGIIQ